MGYRSGHDRRFSRLLPADQPAIWHPVDDALIAGPLDGLRDPAHHLTPDLLRNVDAVLGFRGSMSIYGDLLLHIPLILNLSASTTMGDHTRKVLVGSVEDAVRRGADAVACHVNFTAPDEAEMLRNLSAVVTTAERYGMPVVAFAYVRRRHADGSDDNYLDERRSDCEGYGRMVAHAVRAAVELGASAVKTTYTGSAETFARVVDGACGVPVVIAGEALAAEDVVHERAATAVSVGARGVAFGRQIFERKDAAAFTERLRARLVDAHAARLVPR